MEQKKQFIVNVDSIYFEGKGYCISKEGELCHFGDGGSVFDSEYDDPQEAINAFLDGVDEEDRDGYRFTIKEL